MVRLHSFRPNFRRECDDGAAILFTTIGSEESGAVARKRVRKAQQEDEARGLDPQPIALTKRPVARASQPVRMAYVPPPGTIAMSLIGCMHSIR